MQRDWRNNSSIIIVHVVNLFFGINVKKNTERSVVDILFIMYKMFVDKKRTKDKYSVFDKYSLFIKNESDDSLFKTRLLTGRTMINKIQIYIKLWNINKQNSKKNAWQSTKYNYQVHGIISHICTSIKCMIITPIFKCYSTTFYHRQRLTSQTWLEARIQKLQFYCQHSSFSNLSGKK